MRTAREQANIRLVERVYEEVLGPIESGAVDGLFDPGYIQHNPGIATGAEALRAMLDRAKVKYPHAVHHVKRMIAEDDLVMAHVHIIFEPGTPGVAAVDIFRIENGRIAEHWDVAQPVSTAPNNANTMF